MANDCLFSKLKKSVQNDSLPYFNALVITYKAAEGASRIPTALYSGSSIVQPTIYELEILSNNAYLADNNGNNFGSKHTYDGASYIIPNNFEEEVKVKFSPIENFMGMALYINSKWDFNIEDCYGTNIKILQLNSDVSLNDIIDAEQTNIVTMVTPKLHGSIVELSKLLVLETCYVDSADFVGDILNYVNAIRENKNSGQIELRAVRNKITFNGVNIDIQYNKFIEWDASSILVYGSKFENPYAWTYGATAQQISDLEGQGYTVTAVD